MEYVLLFFVFMCVGCQFRGWVRNCWINPIKPILSHRAFIYRVFQNKNVYNTYSNVPPHTYVNMSNLKKAKFAASANKHSPAPAYWAMGGRK